MQEYLEEIEFERHLFFEGVATLKYSGKLKKFESEKEGVSVFRHARYYDVEISEIKELSQDEYRNWKKLFELRNLEGDVVARYLEDNYRLNVDVLYIHEEPVLTHNQVEGEDVHGFFVSIPVAFKMRKKEKALACKKGLATGAEEQRDDGVYAEFFTGEFEDEVNKICATHWVKIGGTPCVEGAETGEVEYKGNQYRKEYFKANCERYWGDWIGEKCIQDSPTGEERVENGYKQKQFYNIDCSTYWKNVVKIDDGGDNGEGNGGCWDLFSIIPLILFFGLLIYLSVYFHSILPILLGVGAPLLVMLVLGALRLFDRFPKQITFVGVWLFRILLFLLLISFVHGMLSLFKSSNWEGGNNGKKPDNETVHSWDIDESDVYVSPDGQESNYIPEKPDGSMDEDHKIRKKIKVTLDWSTVSGKKYTGSYELYKDEINSSAANLRMTSFSNFTSYNMVYRSVYNKDKYFLNSVYAMLDSIRESNSLNRMEFANAITGMVQSIDYVLILESDCNDPKVLVDADIRNMLRSGVSCEGNAPFGIKTPLEFLSTMKGDCDTRTLLLFTLFKYFNYEVAIINSDYYGHSMLGLNLSSARGVYKKYNGVKYYFLETTNKGFAIGELPREMSYMNFWNVEIN